MHPLPLSLFTRKPNGDYRSSPGSKDRSRSPIERVVMAGTLGVHGNHLYSHHHHHHLASLAAMEQPLALTKNSMVDSVRGSAAALVTMPQTVERQQVNEPISYPDPVSLWVKTSTCLVVVGLREM